MKKALVVFLVLGLMVSLSGLALAADKITHKAAASAAVQESVQLTVSAQQAKEIEAGAVAKLNARTWTVYLTLRGLPPAGKKATVENDVLTFNGNGVVSKYLTSMAFGGSKYSLTIQPDGVAVWETIQETPEGDYAAWRGELVGDEMRGMLNIKTKAGVVEKYNFSTNMPK